MKLNPFDLLNAIRRKDNPFREETREERLKKKQKEIEVIEGVKRMGILCQKIVSDQRYLEFAEVFKRIEQNLLDLMVNCDVDDRDKYFLKMREYQFKLRMFKQILRIPQEFIEEERKIQEEEKNRTEVK